MREFGGRPFHEADESERKKLAPGRKPTGNESQAMAARKRMERRLRGLGEGNLAPGREPRSDAEESVSKKMAREAMSMPDKEVKQPDENQDTVQEEDSPEK